MPRVTRRRFLEESMIAAALAAATPTQLMAQDAATDSPGSTIRHAVIGCRIRGKVHAREFAQQPGVEVEIGRAHV